MKTFQIAVLIAVYCQFATNPVLKQFSSTGLVLAFVLYGILVPIGNIVWEHELSTNQDKRQEFLAKIKNRTLLEKFLNLAVWPVEIATVIGFTLSNHPILAAWIVLAYLLSAYLCLESHKHLKKEPVPNQT